MTGTTGAAASSIDGVTAQLAFALQIGDEDKSKRTKIKQPSQEQFDQCAQRIGAIMDEMSMLGAPQLGRIDEKLQYLQGQRQQRGFAFGGTVIMLAGDWLQLPAVEATPLYARDCKGYAKRSQEAYRSIVDCIYLKQNMRSD